MPIKGVTRVAEYTFSQFIFDEMKRRDMGVREFSDLVKVSHATISKHVAGKGGVPSAEFVIKLSDATGVDLISLFAIAYPEVAHKLMIDPKLLILARRLDNQPQEVKDFIFGASGFK